MQNHNLANVMLNFNLNVEDGWPPVAIESIPFKKVKLGYKVLGAPLFIKNLSVGDVISAKTIGRNSVESWVHMHYSKHTTIWLLRLSEPNQINIVLEKLRALGCNTTALANLGCFAVDVPEGISLKIVDSALEALDEDSVAIAFPSMRHDL
jgi:hypothetical protein